MKVERFKERVVEIKGESSGDLMMKVGRFWYDGIIIIDVAK